MAGKSNSLTIMFIPDGRGRSASLHVPRTVVWALLAFLLFFIAGMACLVLLAGDIALRLQLVSTLQQQNKALEAENGRLLRDVRKIEDIRRINDYLSRVLRAAGDAQGSARGTEGRNAPALSKDTLSLLARNLASTASEHPADLHPSQRPTATVSDALPYLRPVDGWITKTFVAGDSAGTREHLGVDFAAATGAPILATSPGVVTEVANDLYFGKILTIKHHDNFQTRYGHCSQILVTEGAHVRRGQTIASVGNTGNSSAPHLHYEVIKDGKQVDPMRYILGRQQ